MNYLPDSARLRTLIGRQLLFRGVTCEIIEYIESSPALVLQPLNSRVIQGDRHGDAQRRVPETITLPLTDADEQSLTVEAAALIQSALSDNH